MHLLQGVLAAGKAPILPLPGSRPVHWLWNELGELALGTLPRTRLWAWQSVRAAYQVADPEGSTLLVSSCIAWCAVKG